MKPRLVIITEIIAPYRVPVFNSLAARGDVDLHVVFLAETDPKLRQWTIPKDEIRFSYHVLPSLRLRLGNLNLLLNRGLDRALRRARPDVIVCGGYNYPSAWRAAFWARKRNIPFLLWTESNASDHRGRSALAEHLKRKFLGMCRGFVAAGESSKSYLQQLGLPAELIFKAPDAVDNELFTQGARIARANLASVRRRIDVPERYFLNVGRLIRAKGVLDLLEAYANLDEEIRAAVGLVFVGEGDAKSELIRRASLIRPGTVKFSAFVQKEQLAEFYALADAFVFPTHSDPWGLVVNEAMACSLPVIASNVAGCVSDLVEDSWNGFIAPVRDVNRICSSMELLAKDNDLRGQMGERSLQRIQEYSPDACAAGIAKAAFAAGGDVL
jgi:glycosyltransferase involved in cell wall biosynthesis